MQFLEPIHMTSIVYSHCLSRKVGAVRLCCTVVLAMVLYGCQPKNRVSDPLLQCAIDTLWSNSSYAACLLDSITPGMLDDYDSHRYALTKAHVSLKRKQCLPDGSDMLSLATYFDACGDGQNAGEAYYVQGAWENYVGDKLHAMEHLKHAEHYRTDAIIRGMTYYKMGRISEDDRLYDVAAHYYATSLPYLLEAGYPLYIASAYRELGRTVADTSATQELRLGYMEESLRYAKETGDTLLYMEILYSCAMLKSAAAPDVVDISRYLCLQQGQRRYAYDMIKYYARRNEVDSVRAYLDILSQDTTLQWSKYQYSLWHSQWLHLQGLDSSAYTELLGLYTQRMGDIVDAGESRTYVIAQRYDNEAERAKNLQLALDKQRLYVTLAVIVIVVLVLAIGVVIYTLRRRTETLLERERAKEEIERLNSELLLRRKALKQVLDQRIALTKNLQEAILHKRGNEAVPQWAKAYIESNIFTNTEQWQHFLQEFNGCYNNLLTDLQQRCPKLTIADMQVIALTIVGVDIADICLLLGLSQRTVWSRRQRIKNRLGLTGTQDIAQLVGDSLIGDAEGAGV